MVWEWDGCPCMILWQFRARLSSFKYSYGPRVQIVAIKVNSQDKKLRVEGYTWATHLCYLFPSSGSLPCFKASTCSYICSSAFCSLRAAKRTGSVSAKGQFLSTILGRSGNEGWGCPSFSIRIIWMSRPLAALSPSAVSLESERIGVALREEDGKPPY